MPDDTVCARAVLDPSTASFVAQGVKPVVHESACSLVNPGEHPMNCHTDNAPNLGASAQCAQ
jgi:hypothetical protein